MLQAIKARITMLLWGCSTAACHLLSEHVTAGGHKAMTALTHRLVAVWSNAILSWHRILGKLLTTLWFTSQICTSGTKEHRWPGFNKSNLKAVNCTVVFTTTHRLSCLLTVLFPHESFYPAQFREHSIACPGWCERIRIFKPSHKLEQGASEPILQHQHQCPFLTSSHWK